MNDILKEGKMEFDMFSKRILCQPLFFCDFDINLMNYQVILVFVVSHIL
jgi:hypothetical protein